MLRTVRPWVARSEDGAAHCDVDVSLKYNNNGEVLAPPHPELAAAAPASSAFAAAGPVVANSHPRLSGLQVC
jgi:hypothetical protein